MHGSGFSVQDSGCRVQGRGCRVLGAGFGVDVVARDVEQRPPPNWGPVPPRVLQTSIKSLFQKIVGNSRQKLIKIGLQNGNEITLERLGACFGVEQFSDLSATHRYEIMNKGSKSSHFWQTLKLRDDAKKGQNWSHCS